MLRLHFERCKALRTGIASLSLALLGLLLIFPARALTLSGPVDHAMYEQTRLAIKNGVTSIDIASPGGNAALGWVMGDQLREAGVKVRCIGVCASSAAQILLASKGCIVARQGHIVLHVPQVILAGLYDSDPATLAKPVRDPWRARMSAAGVP